MREAHAFRMTRNSDLYIDEEEAENLLHTIEEELRRLRSAATPSAWKWRPNTPPETERFLLETFRLTEADLYRLPGPINFLHLQPLYGNRRLPAAARPSFPTGAGQGIAPGRGSSSR